MRDEIVELTLLDFSHFFKMVAIFINFTQLLIFFCQKIQFRSHKSRSFNGNHFSNMWVCFDFWIHTFMCNFTKLQFWMHFHFTSSLHMIQNFFRFFILFAHDSKFFLIFHPPSTFFKKFSIFHPPSALFKKK